MIVLEILQKLFCTHHECLHYKFSDKHSNNNALLGRSTHKAYYD